MRYKLDLTCKCITYNHCRISTNRVVLSMWIYLNTSIAVLMLSYAPNALMIQYAISIVVPTGYFAVFLLRLLSSYCCSLTHCVWLVVITAHWVYYDSLNNYCRNHFQFLPTVYSSVACLQQCFYCFFIHVRNAILSVATSCQCIYTVWIHNSEFYTSTTKRCSIYFLIPNEI